MAHYFDQKTNRNTWEKGSCDQLLVLKEQKITVHEQKREAKDFDEVVWVRELLIFRARS
jgi:hypothetical protein